MHIIKNKHKLLVFLVLSGFLLGVSGLLFTRQHIASAAVPSVVINELMYHPASGNEAEEYLELYNTTGTTIDLEGWCFTAGITLCFTAGTTIASHDYIIISPNSAQTFTTYGVTPIATYSGALSNGGETITLQDDSATIVNSITYDDAAPWPLIPDGNGPSLELKDPTLDNTQAGSWGASISGPTPAAQNSLVTADLPVITNVMKPTNVTAIDSPTITVEVDNAAVVELVYKVGFGADQTVAMFDDGAHGDGASGDGIFGASIPTQIAGTLVRYRIRAENITDTATSPGADDSMNYHGYVVEDPTLTGTTPVLQWFISDTDYDALQLEDVADKNYYSAVIAYGDQVFDNAEIRLKGEYSATFAKKPYKVKLPSGYKLAMPGILTVPLNEFHLNSDFPKNEYVVSLVSWRAFEHAGFPVPQVKKVQLQKNGDFEGAYTLAEKYDNEWYDRNPTFATGSVYEDFWEKERPDDGDLTEIQAWRTQTLSLTGESKRNYVLDNNDIPNIINFMATQAVIRHHDWGIETNTFAYRDTADTNRWKVLPWDLDLSQQSLAVSGAGEFADMVDPTIVPDYIDPETRFFATAIWEQPDLRAMYERRLRTLIDELSISGLMRSWVDEEYAVAETAAELDYPKWKSADAAVSTDPIVDYIENTLGLDASDPAVVSQFAIATYGAEAVNQFPDPITAIEPLTPANKMSLLKYGLQKRAELNATDFVARGVVPSAQASAPNIIINEINYNPAGGADHEYLELYNPSDTPIDMSGWRLDGIDYDFPGGAVIPAQGHALLVKNDVEFRNEYGPGHLIFGQYSGNLANEGETLRLLRADDSMAYQFAYGVDGGWPTGANGGGSSLELIRFSANANLAACWAPSVGSGSPGAENNPDTEWLVSNANGCTDTETAAGGLTSWLADTGRNLWKFIALAVLLVGAGVGLMWWSRRNTPRSKVRR